MSQIVAVRGSIPEIVRNDEGLYLGKLSHYYRAVFMKAHNLLHPYHNFRHTFHVVWLCHEAIRFYRRTIMVLRPQEARNLLIAAMFHDFDHAGALAKNDAQNIARAVEGLKQNILDCDESQMSDIIELIKSTEFPYSTRDVSFRAQILRDADLSQAFSVAWLQQVVFGLAAEWGKTPLEVLQMQDTFLSKIEFQTEWAREMFPQRDVDAKIREAREHLELLEG